MSSWSIFALHLPFAFSTIDPGGYMADYNFIALCPHCNQRRGVTCSREQARTGERIEVYAIQCDHQWMLSIEDSRLLREESITIHS